MIDLSKIPDKKKSKTNLNYKTRLELNKNNFTTYQAEKFSFYSNKTNDMFKCIDLISFYKNETFLIQVCNYSNRRSRYQKIITSKELFNVLKDSHNHHAFLFLWDKDTTTNRWLFSVQQVNISEFLISYE